MAQSTVSVHVVSRGGVNPLLSLSYTSDELLHVQMQILKQ